MPRHLPVVLVAAAAWFLAAWARLRALDSASLGSDALGQYLAAWSAGWTWLPRPPNPEAGPGLWLLAVPLVHLAGSLEGLFRLRFVVGALAAPLGALAAWRAGGGLVGAALAGAWLALDPGLCDTLVVAFRGYGAPELLAAATLALTWRERPRALAAGTLLLVLASDQHPLAGGAALGALAALPWLGRELGRRPLLVAAGVGLLALLPRLWLTARLLGCGQGPWACLAGVALGSTEAGASAGFLVRRALWDRFAVEHGWLTAALVTGLLLAALDRKARPLLAWALGSALGIVLAGLVVHTLRAYHLRMAAAPLVVAAAVGLGRRWPLGLAAGAWVAWSWRAVTVVGPHPGGLRTADALARELVAVEAPLRVDGVWMDRPEGIEPAAVVLAAVLQGQDPARFQVSRQARVVLLVNEAGQTTGRRFADLDAARAWVAPLRPSRTGGAYDWMTALHPRAAELEAASF